MSVITLIQSFLKEKSIPIIYLVGVLYLFSIDIVVLILLGYYPKDFFYLLDVQRIVLFNTIIITFFTILMIMIRKHLIASATIIIVLASLYAMSNNLDVNNFLSPILILFVFFVALVFNAYKVWIEPWLDNLLKLSIANGLIGFFIALIMFVYIDGNIAKWNDAIIHDDKIILDKTPTPFLIIQPKSFNPIYLQNLNQDLKLFVNSDFAKSFLEQTYEQDEITDKDFVLIPHSGTIINDNPITVYYYNIDDIKNIFIINPKTCNKDGKCILKTLITKAINKNDASKGYQLISEYSHEIELKNTITQQVEASMTKGF